MRLRDVGSDASEAMSAEILTDASGKSFWGSIQRFLFLLPSADAFSSHRPPSSPPAVNHNQMCGFARSHLRSERCSSSSIGDIHSGNRQTRKEDEEKKHESDLNSVVFFFPSHFSSPPSLNTLPVIPRPPPVYFLLFSFYRASFSQWVVGWWERCQLCSVLHTMRKCCSMGCCV